MLTENILDLIGNTPIIKLKNENIFAKAEFLKALFVRVIQHICQFGNGFAQTFFVLFVWSIFTSLPKSGENLLIYNCMPQH